MGVVVSLEESKRAAGIQRLVDLARPDMERVNELILSKAGSDVEMIPEVANHLPGGGSRLKFTTDDPELVSGRAVKRVGRRRECAAR